MIRAVFSIVRGLFDARRSQPEPRPD